MLKKLVITNFRGFEEHEMPFRSTTIAVGRNNAGKSTFIEALRIIAIVTQRYKNLAYKEPPDWLDIPKTYYGASIDLNNLQIDFDTICYEYNEPPAVIEAFFKDGQVIIVYLSNEKKVHVVLFNEKGKTIKNRSEAWNLSLPQVSILPQISPLSREEKILNREYILGAVDSHLSSYHFRNQLFQLSALMPEFRRISEETWPGLQVRDLDSSRGYPGDPLSLELRNEEFVGEIGRMGHGLQMWLQCIWFLTRAKNADTLILDEPDVYMHPDLQRRLVRYLKATKQQVIIATHSVEIVSEVEPQDIMVIERKRKKSQFADSIPSVQKVLERVGSTQNIHLARLWNAKRFIIAEGHDIRILKHFYDILFPGSHTSLDAIPNMSIGGWGGWSWAIGSSLAMKNAFGEAVNCYCIFDRDYHTDQEILQRYEESRNKGIYLHVWHRKELENYLLEPSTISRVISKQRGNKKVSSSDVLSILVKLANKQEVEFLDGIAEELCHIDKGLKAGGANKKARKILESRKSSERGLIDLVSGKRLLSGFSEYSKNKYGVSVSPISIVREFSQKEISEEMKNIFIALEKSLPFPKENIY
jgi:AAA15 family ATPase/GTPase